MTGISKTQLHQYETCGKDIKALNLGKVCTALGISADFLIFGKKD
jgi:DNA-binding Xre family transcriptional regulator